MFNRFLSSILLVNHCKKIAEYTQIPQNLLEEIPKENLPTLVKACENGDISPVFYACIENDLNSISLLENSKFKTLSPLTRANIQQGIHEKNPSNFTKSDIVIHHPIQKNELANSTTIGFEFEMIDPYHQKSFKDNVVGTLFPIFPASAKILDKAQEGQLIDCCFILPPPLKFDKDTSIDPNGGHPIELVSPILRNNAAILAMYHLIQKICDEGALGNASTSDQIHMDLTKYDEKTKIQIMAHTLTALTHLREKIRPYMQSDYNYPNWARCLPDINLDCPNFDDFKTNNPNYDNHFHMLNNLNKDYDKSKLETFSENIKTYLNNIKLFKSSIDLAYYAISPKIDTNYDETITYQREKWRNGKEEPNQLEQRFRDINFKIIDGKVATIEWRSLTSLFEKDAYIENPVKKSSTSILRMAKLIQDIQIQIEKIVEEENSENGLTNDRQKEIYINIENAFKKFGSGSALDRLIDILEMPVKKDSHDQKFDNEFARYLNLNLMKHLMPEDKEELNDYLHQRALEYSELLPRIQQIQEKLND